MSVRAKRTAQVEAESAIHAFTKAIMAPLTIRDAAPMEAPGALHSPYMVVSVLV